MQVINKVISDVGSIRGLDKAIQKVVIECYVQSLKYSHSKFFPILLVEIDTYDEGSGISGSLTVGVGDSFYDSGTFFAIDW